MDSRKSVVKALPRHFRIINIATSLRELLLKTPVVQGMPLAHERQTKGL